MISYIGTKLAWTALKSWMQYPSMMAKGKAVTNLERANRGQRESSLAAQDKD